MNVNWIDVLDIKATCYVRCGLVILPYIAKHNKQNLRSELNKVRCVLKTLSLIMIKHVTPFVSFLYVKCLHKIQT